jgi:alpha-L-fucosidase 2
MKEVKRETIVLLAMLLCLFACKREHNNQELLLSYDAPARIWEETLPLGNGRIGMMPDGGVEVEKILLNDITMWSGSEEPEALNPEAINYLPQIRQLLLEGNNLEAQRLMYDHFRCGGQGSALGSGKDTPYGSFQMVGELRLKHRYPHGESIRDYERTLSLNDAVATTRFISGSTA